jgi:hypothetical protein
LATEGHSFFQHLQPFLPDFDSGIEGDAGEIAAGTGKAGDQPRFQRIQHERNNRYGPCCRRDHSDHGVSSERPKEIPLQGSNAGGRENEWR